MTTPPVLNGQRVTLVPLGPDHAQAMYAGLDDAEGNRLTGTTERFTYDEVAAHCARVGTDETRLDWAILADGDVQGEGVLFDIHRGEAWFRIAIWTATGRNRGFGSEALRLVLQHAFGSLGLSAVRLEVYAFNPRALHVYRRAGFVETARRPGALIWDGEAVDAIEMRATRPDAH